MQEGGDDVGKTLLSEGLIIVEKRKEKRLQKLVQEYTRAQESARKARVSPDYRCETAIYKITRASVSIPKLLRVSFCKRQERSRPWTCYNSEVVLRKKKCYSSNNFFQEVVFPRNCL